MKNILVNLQVEPRHKAKLEAAAPGCAFTYAPGKELTREQVEKAQIIIGNPPPAWGRIPTSSPASWRREPP